MIYPPCTPNSLFYRLKALSLSLARFLVKALQSKKMLSIGELSLVLTGWEDDGVLVVANALWCNFDLLYLNKYFCTYKVE
jgi:hypothetical protein